MKFLPVSILAAALPTLVLGLDRYPCLKGYDETGLHGSSYKTCAGQAEQCLPFHPDEDLLINHLLSAQAINNMEDGGSRGWLYQSADCSGEGKFVDAEGWPDLSKDPPYHSYLAKF